MNVTIEYVNQIEKNYRTTNGKELAKLLGVAEMSVSRYRNGQKGFADEVALKVGELLGIKGELILVQLQEERAATPEAKAAWHEIAKNLNEWRKR